MGSFNTTCFVSQQTISTGDKAVVMPIKQQTTYNPVQLHVSGREGVKEVAKYGYANTTCYSTAFWGFAGPILNGEYSDYGNFEWENSEENIKNIRSFLNYLSNSVCDVVQGENKYHDHPLDFASIYNPKEKYSFQQLEEIMGKVWDVASEARLFVRNYNGEPVNVAFAVMHEPAAEYLIKEVGKSKGWDGESYEQKSYFNNYLNKKFSEMMEVFKGKDLDNTIAFFVSNVSGLESYRIGEQEGTHIRNYYDRSRYVMDKIQSYLKEGNTEFSRDFTDELFEKFKSQIDHRYIAAGLERINVKLSPMVYASQDYSNDLGNTYLKMVQEVNSKINAMVKAKYGEEDEDDYEEEKPTKKRKLKS